MNIQSRTDAEAYLGTKTERPLANNTRIRRDPDGVIHVRLHDTDVVSYLPDGSCVLDSGGWRTYTTKDRMNAFGPASVYVWQEDGEWYVSNRQRYVGFRDGMRIGPRGGLPTPGKNGNGNHKLRKEIRAYAGRFVDALFRGEVGLPDGGDCWFCLLFERDNHKPTPERADHLLEHMKDDYFVPSLLFNAMQWAGAGQGWYWTWGALVEGKRPFVDNSAQYRRFLTRYLQLKLGV